MAERYTGLLQGLILCVCLGVSAAGSQSAPRLALLADFGGDASGMVRSANGLVYYVSGPGELRALNPATGDSFRVDSGEFADVAISPSGDRLAFVRMDSIGGTVWTVRLNPRTGRIAGSPRRLSLHYGRGPEFSPDGRFIAFTVLPATDTLVTPRIIRVPVAGGPEQIVAREAGWALPLRWSADAKWIYYHHGNRGIHTLRRVSANGGASEVLAPSGDLIAVSPNGRLMVHSLPLSKQAPLKIMVISDDRGKELTRVTLPAGVEPVSWGASAFQLLAKKTESRRALHFADLNGQVTELLPPTALPRSIASSSDGRELLVTTEIGSREERTVVDLLTRQTHAAPTDVGTEWLIARTDGLKRTTNWPRGVQAAENERPADCEPVFVDNWSRMFAITLNACRRRGVLELRTPSLRGQRPVTRDVPIDGDERPVVVRGDDSTVVVAMTYRLISVPLHGGSVRTLYTASGGRRILLGSASVATDANWVAVVSIPQTSNSEIILHMIPLKGGTARDLTLPAEPLGPMRWDPRQRFVVFVGDQNADWHVWLQPLNGDRAFTLTRAEPLGIPEGMCCWIAADGSGVAYTLASGFNVSLWTIDLSAALSARGRSKP